MNTPLTLRKKSKAMNKEIFKKQLKLIEIEIFSYCNRKCWFCPNSFVDRISDNKIMPEETYLDLLNQLQEIDFSGELTYSRYNEPTSKRELFIERIKSARKILPNAILRTNTNGDYMTRDYIEELCDVGFNQLWIQQYLGNNQKYDHDTMRSRAETKIKKLGLKSKIITDIPGYKLEYDISHRNMTIHIRSRNFDIDGSSRGDTIAVSSEYTRTQRCMQPFNNMYIDYNGSVMVCCALRSDVAAHKSGIMGQISKNKLWDIYASEQYKPWRQHHLVDGPKKGFCKTCKDSVNFELEVKK